MTWVLMGMGVLCIIGGLLSMFSDGAAGGLVFVGGWILVGIGAVVDQLSAIRKILKARKE